MQGRREKERCGGRGEEEGKGRGREEEKLDLLLRFAMTQVKVTCVLNTNASPQSLK